MFSFGDDPLELAKFGNIVDRPTAALFPDRVPIEADDGHIFTAPRGSYLPNSLGLYDMHGNVWEWTADWFAAPAAPAVADNLIIDPQGPAAGTQRVVRGGDWYHHWSFARCAQRFPIPPYFCRRHAGFRVLREVADD